MPALSRCAALLLMLLVSACSTLGAKDPPPKARLTVLISIDGFRADYLDRGDTPTLTALAAEGARGAMRPSFPSLTFPNHYALITGQRPDHNGIVSNTMEDPEIPGVTFTLSNREVSADPRWWNQAAPLWVTAEQQGVRTATMFWPGSEYAIREVRPTRFKVFDQKLASNDRVDTLLGWLDVPGGAPLGFATLYFDIVDTQGHRFGPESAEVRVAAGQVDAAIGRLVAGLKARGLFETTNLVIVADHGMAPQPVSNRVILDEAVDVRQLRLVGAGAVAGIKPNPGAEAAVAAALLKPHPHMTCWNKAQIPARFHYGTNPRVPAIICLAQTGWYITTAEMVARRSGESAQRDGGAHGYDPADPTMQAVFVARGPVHGLGVSLPVFDKVDVYPLLARVIGVEGERCDGRLSPTRPALRDGVLRQLLRLP